MAISWQQPQSLLQTPDIMHSLSKLSSDFKQATGSPAPMSMESSVDRAAKICKSLLEVDSADHPSHGICPLLVGFSPERATMRALHHSFVANSELHPMSEGTELLLHASSMRTDDHQVIES